MQSQREKPDILMKVEPILVGIEDAASLLGISVTAFKALDRAGQIGPLPVKIGTLKRRLWSVNELKQWVQVDCPIREIWQAMREDIVGNLKDIA